MEEIEKTVISESIHFLCRETMGQSQLSVALTSARFLKETEKNEFMTVTYEKNKKLFSHLLTTRIPWTVLLEILDSTGNFHVSHFLTTQLTEIKSSGSAPDNPKVDLLLETCVEKYERELKDFMSGKSALDLKQVGPFHQQIKSKMEIKLQEALNDIQGKVESGKYSIKFNKDINLSFDNLMEEWSLGFLRNTGTTNPGNPKDWRFGEDYREKKLDYAHNFGDDADAALVVGAGKFELRSCKMRLIIASPVFEEQFKSGDLKEMNRLIYISIPNYEPKLFKLFINTLPPVRDYTMDELVREYTQSVSEVLFLMVIRKNTGSLSPTMPSKFVWSPSLRTLWPERSFLWAHCGDDKEEDGGDGDRNEEEGPEVKLKRGGVNFQ